MKKVLLNVFVATCSACAAEIVVDGSQGQMIQSGLDAAKAGDTVIVKPGRYAETVTFKTSGTPEVPITLKAEKPGTVLIDGSDPVTGWQKVAKPEDVANTPNWKNLYFAEVPKDKTCMNLCLYEDGKFCAFAQDPVPSDPFYYDNREEYIPVDAATYSAESITDPKYFTQKDPHYWDGATVIVWTANNNMIYRPVWGFHPETGTINYQSVGGYIRPTRDRFAMANHLDLIRKPGDYVVKKNPATGVNTLYYWPFDVANLDAGKVTRSVRFNGIKTNAQSHLVIEGFDLRGYSDSAIVNPYGKFAENITVRNNHVYQSQHSSAAVALSSVHNALVEDNYIHDIQLGLGIGVVGATNDRDLPARNATIRNNRISRGGRAAIVFFNVTEGKMLGNLVHDNLGHHASGLVAYLGCRDTLVQGNTVMRANCALSVQDGDRLTVRDNIFIGNGEESVHLFLVAAFAANLPNATFENNVLFGARNSFLIPADITNYVIRKNVLCGLDIRTQQRPGELVVENNIITRKTSDASRDATYAENNTFETDLAKIFVDAVNGDFRRVKGGPLMEAGLLESGRKIDLHPGPWPGRQ